MTRRRLDAETLELLHDEPELLAIAEAVRATQTPPAKRRHRHAAPALILSLAVVASLAIARLTFSGSDHLLPTVRAAAGSPAGLLQTTLVPATAGPTLRIEFDPRTRLARVTSQRKGVPPLHFDVPIRSPQVRGSRLPLLADAFVASYRQAVETGSVVSAPGPPGSGLRWVRVQPHGGRPYLVGLDSVSGAPRRLGQGSNGFRITLYFSAAAARQNG